MDGRGEASESNPFLILDLPAPMPVAAVRLKFAYEATPSPASLELGWRTQGQGDLDLPGQRLGWSQPTEPGEFCRTLWVNQTIDQIRITPDHKPCKFRLMEVMLLTPGIGHAAASADQPTAPASEQP